MHYGSDLKADFRNPASRTVGVEFTNSSITSNGDGRETQLGWDRLKAENEQLREALALAESMASAMGTQLTKAEGPAPGSVIVDPAPEPAMIPAPPVAPEEEQKAAEATIDSKGHMESLPKDQPAQG